MKYIILNNKKQATHKFKDGVGAKSYDEVKDFNNYAVIVPKPFIILDFDTKSDSEIMLNIIEALDLKCRVMKTTRGIHVWFRSEEPWTCFIKTRLACGLYSDCKSHSKNAYAVIKKDGVKREWLRKCKSDEIQEVPKWLYPISSPSDKFDFKNMGESDGRNQELFNYIVWLQSKGFKKEEVIETINIINDFILGEPLDDFEIDTICRDEAFKNEEEIQKQLFLSDGFKHNELGNMLINKFNIITVNNQIYVYKDGYYQLDKKLIEKEMIKLYPPIKTNQRNEVLNYIRIETHKESEEIKINPFIINLNNCRIDLRTGQKLEFTPEVIEFQRIPITYDSSIIEDESVNRFFNNVSVSDESWETIIYELLATILIKDCRFQKAFLFIGGGSNGKSTVLELIKNFIGKSNYTTLSLDQVNGKFEPAMLENKLANIVDEQSNLKLSNTAMIKSIITGGSILVQNKGEKPFELEPYATHIMACNEIPHSFDTSDGFYRRWVIVPFDAIIKHGTSEYDPQLVNKVFSKKGMSYILNKVIEVAPRLIKDNKYSECDRVDLALEDYKNANEDDDPVIGWVKDNDVTEEYLVQDKAIGDLYINFQNWCKLSGITRIPTKARFSKQIRKRYKLSTKTKRIEGDTKKVFVKEIVA